MLDGWPLGGRCSRGGGVLGVSILATMHERQGYWIVANWNLRCRSKKGALSAGQCSRCVLAIWWTGHARQFEVMPQKAAVETEDARDQGPSQICFNASIVLGRIPIIKTLLLSTSNVECER